MVLFLRNKRFNVMFFGMITQDSNCCMTRAGTTCTVYALIRSDLSRLPSTNPARFKQQMCTGKICNRKVQD